MRKSTVTVATLRSRLRITHAILEELVAIKVAANGVRAKAVIKAISILNENASLGIDHITVSPGFHRLCDAEAVESNVLDHLTLVDNAENVNPSKFRRIITGQPIKKAA